MSDYSDAVLATAGLVHYWRLDESFGLPGEDSEGSTELTIGSSVTRLVRGRTENDVAVGFSRSKPSASSAAVAGPPELPELIGAHSVEFLFKTGTSFGTSNNSCMFGTRGSYNGTEIYIRNDYVLSCIVAGDGITGSSVATTGTVPISQPNGWHHLLLAAGSDPGSTVKLYLDGVLYKESAAYDFPLFLFTTAGGALAHTRAMTVGNLEAANLSTVYNYDGAMQHLAVYDVELDATVAQDHFDAIGPEPAAITNLWTPPVPGISRAFNPPAPAPAPFRPSRMAADPGEDWSLSEPVVGFPGRVGAHLPRTLQVENLGAFRPARSEADPGEDWGTSVSLVAWPWELEGEEEIGSRPAAGQIWPR